MGKHQKFWGTGKHGRGFARHQERFRKTRDQPRKQNRGCYCTLNYNNHVKVAGLDCWVGNPQP